ncbi:MAG: shikimate kinase, partial [Phycisphaeraceae bacterium]
IALGGGTLMQPGARAAVEQAADTRRVYLYAEPAALHRRIEADVHSAATRPALTAHGGGLAEVEAVLAERDPVYRAVADVIFNVTDVTPEEAVRHLVAKHL